MTGTASLIMQFVKRPADQASGSILLEQQPWDKTLGLVTRLDIVQALEKQFFDASGAVVDCGMDSDGSGFTALVFAYPSPDDLPFETGITHGFAGSPMRFEFTMTEQLSFSLDTEQTVKYPVKRFISAAWVDKVYAVDGSILDHPEIVNDGQKIIIGEKVYGTATVRYTTVRYAFSVRITARDTVPENVFQSVFYAWWNGGIELLTVDSPANAEDGYVNQVNCSGGSLSMGPDDPDDETPTVDPKNKEIVLNYCEDFGNEQ